MPALVQICIVIATMALVIMTATSLIVLRRLANEAGRMTLLVHSALVQIEAIAQETREALAAIREVTAPSRVVWQRMQRLGERAVDLSSAVLDEIEEPVVTTVALMRGLKAGTTRLLETLMLRLTPGSSSKNGERDHE